MYESGMAFLEEEDEEMMDEEYYETPSDEKIDFLGEQISDCIADGIKIIIIPIHYRVEIAGGGGGGHANLLIYRVSTNTFERFEPWGNIDEPFTDDVNDVLERTVNKLSKKKYVPSGAKYMPPTESCPSKGFQAIQSNEFKEKFPDEEERKELSKKMGWGFCLMWSMFALELSLMYPDKSFKEAQEIAMDEIKKLGQYGFFKHIVGYTKFAEKKIKELMSDFSFKDLRLIKEKYEEYTQWYNNEVLKIINAQRGKKGKDTIKTPMKGKGFRGGVLSEEKKRQLAMERQAYAKDMKENPEKYVAKSFDPSEGGTKEPCSYRRALDKGGVSFNHLTSAGYQTPEDCQNIQQANINEGQRRMLENESGINKFFRGVVEGLTKVADFAVDLPFVPTIAKEGYKAFAPPTSSYYADSMTRAFSGDGKYKIKGKKITTLKGAGMKPEEKTFFLTAEQTYSDRPPKQIGDFLLIGDSPTIDAWLNYKTNTIMIAVRGTKDFRDVKADTSLPFNNLTNTNRYQNDRNIIASLSRTFNPSVYDYYLTGHSLGGAIVSQLKRDFPFLKDAVLYNSAFQPKDLVQQSSGSIKRVYTTDDPLYNAGGKFFINSRVVPINTTAIDGILGRVIRGYKGHKLSKFRELYAM
jgi:hypothetical protein